MTGSARGCRRHHAHGQPGFHHAGVIGVTQDRAERDQEPAHAHIVRQQCRSDLGEAQVAGLADEYLGQRRAQSLPCQRSSTRKAISAMPGSGVNIRLARPTTWPSCPATME